MKIMKNENNNSQLNADEAKADCSPDEAAPSGPAADDLKAENENLKRALRLREARETVAREFRNAGAVSPELLAQAIESQMQLDDEGTVVNAAALARKLKREFPSQFAAGGSLTPAAIDGGAGSGSSQILTKEALAEMTPAQIAALDWQDVRRVLSGR